MKEAAKKLDFEEAGTRGSHNCAKKWPEPFDFSLLIHALQFCFESSLLAAPVLASIHRECRAEVSEIRRIVVYNRDELKQWSFSSSIRKPNSPVALSFGMCVTRIACGEL